MKKDEVLTNVATFSGTLTLLMYLDNCVELLEKTELEKMYPAWVDDFRAIQTKVSLETVKQVTQWEELAEKLERLTAEEEDSILS